MGGLCTVTSMKRVELQTDWLKLRHNYLLWVQLTIPVKKIIDIIHKLSGREILKLYRKSNYVKSLLSAPTIHNLKVLTWNLRSDEPEMKMSVLSNIYIFNYI